MKKGILLLITMIAAGAPISCEDSTLFVDCNKCYESLSDRTTLEIKVTIDAENYSVPITLYQGNIDDGKVISTDTTFSSTYISPSVTFGQIYSAVAKYSHGGRIIYTVDGRALKKKLDKSSCSTSCYIIQGDVLDLRLK